MWYFLLSLREDIAISMRMLASNHLRTDELSHDGGHCHTGLLAKRDEEPILAFANPEMYLSVTHGNDVL